MKILNLDEKRMEPPNPRFPDEIPERFERQIALQEPKSDSTKTGKNQEEIYNNLIDKLLTFKDGIK